MHKYLYLKIIFLFMSCLHADSLVISMDENQTQMELLDKAFLFKDTTGKLTFEEIKRKKFKSNNKKRLNFGYAYHTTLWIRLTFKNNSQKRQKRVLEFQTAEVIKMYDGEQVFSEGGYRKTIRPTFKILLEANEIKTYYIEAYSNCKILRAKLTLYNQEEFVSNEFRYIIAFVIFMTALGIMFIYNLLLLVVTKDSLYGYYLLYIITLVFFQFILFDIFKLYIPINEFHLFLFKALIFPVIFLISSITIFSMKFLNIWKFPILYKVLKFYLYLLPIIALSAYDNWIINTFTALLLISPWFFMMIFVAFWAWYKGESQAKYYILGWSFFFLVAIITLLRTFGVLSIENELVLIYLYIATFITETLFFSLSITHKIEILKENEEKKLKLLVREKTQKIESMLEQKELLYQELNHRVKNNMQMVLSLITLQIGDTKLQETKEELIATKNRVNSLLGLYDKLYLSSDDIVVDTYVYLENIVKTVQENFNNSVKIGLDIDYQLENSALIYCGLIVNELVTNSFKYAFSHNGRIDISLKKEDNQIVLKVRDNGRGFEKTNRKSLGIEIVKALVYKQFLGTMSIDSSDSGTSIAMQWRER